MPKRNPAELLLDADAGTVPVAMRGPDGVAYRVESMKRWLVIRRGIFNPDLPEEDEVATCEVWTNHLTIAKHLVDRRVPMDLECKCKACRAKKAPKRS